MADKNDSSEVIAEILIELQHVRKDMKENNEILQNTFNTGFSAILKKMDEFTAEVKGLRQDFQKFADHEERIRKIEEIVFKKGA